MATVVVVDAHEGSLHRYEIGGKAARLTHSAHAEGGGPVTFTQDVVEDFRLNPSACFAVDPPTPPTNPPADSGDLPCDVEAQAA